MTIAFTTPLQEIKQACPEQIDDRESFLLRIWLGAMHNGKTLDSITPDEWMRGVDRIRLIVNAKKGDK